MAKLKPTVSYARSDITGKLLITGHVVEMGKFKREQDVIESQTVGPIQIPVEDGKLAPYSGVVLITRRNLLNQLSKALGDETDLWMGRVVEFKAGELQEPISALNKGA